MPPPARGKIICAQTIWRTGADDPGREALVEGRHRRAPRPLRLGEAGLPAVARHPPLAAHGRCGPEAHRPHPRAVRAAGQRLVPRGPHRPAQPAGAGRARRHRRHDDLAGAAVPRGLGAGRAPPRPVRRPHQAPHRDGRGPGLRGGRPRRGRRPRQGVLRAQQATATTSSRSCAPSPAATPTASPSTDAGRSLRRRRRCGCPTRAPGARGGGARRRPASCARRRGPCARGPRPRLGGSPWPRPGR